MKTSNGQPVDPTPDNPLRIESMYAFVVVDPEEVAEIRGYESAKVAQSGVDNAA